MKETITLIDRLLDEHRTINQDAQTLEREANDIEAVVGLKKAEEASLPARFEHKQGLKRLQELLGEIGRGLQAHFNREETALLTAFEQHGDSKLLSTFRSLLLDHEDLRNHLARSEMHVAELIGEGLSHQEWERKARTMQAHISEMRKLLETHAGSEQGLLQMLRSELLTRGQGND